MTAPIASGALAAGERPVARLTPAQEAAFRKTYYNCDHEGAFGCLRAACRARKAPPQDAREIRYLYREVANDFPEFLTPTLRACFVRAGGRFR